jgi:hypothetical protein
MVRKILSDLISGVRDGVAWGLCFVAIMPRRRRVWSELLHVGRARASSPPWPEVVARAEKKRAELAVKNRYGRFLDLSELETMAWPSHAELRDQYERAARTIADAFGTPITIISYDGRELAIVDPSTN